MTFREEVGSEGPVPSAAEGGPPGPLLCLSATSFLCPAQPGSALPFCTRVTPGGSAAGRDAHAPPGGAVPGAGASPAVPSFPLPYS